MKTLTNGNNNSNILLLSFTKIKLDYKEKADE